MTITELDHDVHGFVERPSAGFVRADFLAHRGSRIIVALVDGMVLSGTLVAVARRHTDHYELGGFLMIHIGLPEDIHVAVDLDDVTRVQIQNPDDADEVPPTFAPRKPATANA